METQEEKRPWAENHGGMARNETGTTNRSSDYERSSKPNREVKQECHSLLLPLMPLLIIQVLSSRKRGIVKIMRNIEDTPKGII